MMSNLINKSDSFFVAGHRGMAGSAICRALKRSGYQNLLTASRDEVDLLDIQAVQRWFEEKKPTIVVLAAAKVGGIHANDTYPADLLHQNLKIQTNVIETAWQSELSVCCFLVVAVFIRSLLQPIQEESLMTGALESINEWYDSQDHRN